MTSTVVHFTDSDEFGGTEQVVLQLLSGLDRRRWRPVLMHHGGASHERLAAGANEVGVEFRLVPRVSRRSDVLSGILPLVRAIRAEHPAVFHAHLAASLSGKYGLIAAALSRVFAVVGTAHLFTEVPPGLRADLNHRAARACVDRYIAVSEEVARRMRARFRVPASKLQVVRNGIDLDRYCRAADPRLRLLLARDEPRAVVLTVARLDPQKGHEYLLAAAAAIPQAVFVFAGEGEERPRLERMARALGVADRVRFLGHRSDIPDLLAVCDVFVLPSLYEGLPLAVLEAMAAAKPVVATAVGGTDEAVTNGKSGLLVPPAEPSALAGAIRTVLGDPTVARRLGEAGQARARREFSASRMIREVSGVYEDLLERVGSDRRARG
ncbi:MAG: glycosyltransferase [Gemmatimonadales bacterium]|nr:glycosyltransferase [Gemmatimonadales bacterium]